MVKVGDTIGETIFTFAYWKEFFKMKHLPNFNQTWNKHFLDPVAWWEFKFIQMKVKVVFKGGKCKNRVGSFQYFLLMNHSTIKAQIYMSAS
jgi:hypothetical protein